MNASNVMTYKVVSVGLDAPIGDAIRLMLDHRISGLPVVDRASKVIGILKEGDLLRRAERPRWLELLLGPDRLADEYVRTHGRKAARS
jgi:CBS domain-containing protein